MKRLRILGYIAIFASLITLDSCLPIDEVVADRIPALTSSAWTFSEITNGDQFFKDNYTTYFDGQVVTFYSDGTYSQNLALYNLTGNWQFNDSQSILYYDVGTSEEQSREIITLNDTEFHFRVNWGGTLIEVRFIH